MNKLSPSASDICCNNVRDMTSKKHNLKSLLRVLSSLLICADNVIQFKRLIAEEPQWGSIHS